MKKKFFALAFVLCSCLNAFSQATSLTIDCQTPGWLSSMINYGDQQTLESIKVTGYINGTDINFIKELNLSHNLCQVIDLEDANIVGSNENTISDKMFANLNHIRKVILPNSITEFTTGSSTTNYCWVGDQFSNTSVDTLVINGSLSTISIGNKWGTRCIYFSEGITEIVFAGFPRATLTNVELFLPSTLEKVVCIGVFDDNAIFHCNSLNPEIIQASSNPGASPVPNKGTIYVPKGTKEKYEQSIFSNLVIIEVIPDGGVSSDQTTITMGSNGIATFSDGNALDFTSVSGLKAYIGSGYNPATGDLTMTRVYKVPAGEGLLLKGVAGSYDVPYEETNAYYANLLVGVPTATTVSPTVGDYTNFILSKDEVRGIGFYPLVSSGEIGANKAYLQLPTSILPAASRSLRMVFDDEEDVTGIKDLNEKGAMRNEKFFDLQGRRVVKPTRGLYIKNGKKIMVK